MLDKLRIRLGSPLEEVGEVVNHSYDKDHREQLSTTYHSIRVEANKNQSAHGPHGR